MINKIIYPLSVYLQNGNLYLIKDKKKQKEKVYIVGNGWASYYFVKNLNKMKYEPIIIAPNSKVLNTPKLVDRILDSNIDPQFSNPYAIIINDVVDDIDIKKNTLITKSGSTYKYNRVVFAIGSETNDYGIPGVNEYTYKLKTIADADIIRNKICQNKKFLSTIYIIGGGITGIELSSKIKNGSKIIIEGTNSILLGCEEKTKLDIMNEIKFGCDKTLQIQLSQMVKSIDKNLISMEIQSDKKKIQEYYNSNHDMIIWTGGVRFNGFGKTQLFRTLNSIVPIKPRGLDVERDFSLKDQNSIYCLGDMVSNAGPPTAQNAKNQAQWLAEYFNSDFDLEYIKKNPYKVKSNGKLIHLENKTYLESEYYSGYIPSFISKIVEWIE